jgi:hypothetical protein
MQIAQRGTSVASITTSGYRTVDRFNLDLSSLGTWTMTQENDAPTGSGFRNSAKVNCTTADASPAADDYFAFGQIIEGQNLQHIKKGTASAEQLTLSFWVKANVTGTYIVNLYDLDNNREISKSYTISASATWERKTITFPADTTGAYDNDNGGSLTVNFFLAVGSNRSSGTLNSTSWNSATNANRAVGQVNLASATSNYWQITGVQLEVGDTATPFEFLPAQQELAQCQRYYYRLSLNSSTNYGAIAAGYALTTSSAYYSVTNPTSMRVPAHTLGSSAADTFFIDSQTGSGAATSILLNARHTGTSWEFGLGKTGLTAGQGLMLLQDGTDTTYLELSAEL